MEAVVTEAVALLDEAGEPALTFRALAARLGGGVGSIYWYVSSRDELLERAADSVIGDVLAQTDHVGGGDDPIADVRELAVAFYDATARRPWLAAYFLQDTGTQVNGLRYFDRMGRALMRLHLTPREQLDAVAAITSYVVGVAADRGHDTPEAVRDGSATRAELEAGFRDEVRALDAQEFPFLHHVIDEFVTHHDDDQFRAGLDLLLAGLRLQAGR